MHSEEIAEEALRGETSRVEWKESDRKKDEILQAVCALANDLEDNKLPGYLVIGIRNDGKPVGEKLDATEQDKVSQRIASWLHSTRLLPTPSTDVFFYEHPRGPTLTVIRVEPHPVPPTVKLDGVPRVRVGTTTRKATDADIGRLEERRPEGNLPFDLRVVPGTSLDDLNLKELQRFHDADALERGDPETFPELDRWLFQRELVKHGQDDWQPNAAALLLYGRSPQSFFPGAVIELVRFDGDDFDAPVKFRKTITGTLFDQLDTLWSQLLALVTDVPAPAEGVRTPYRPEYPPEALKELARNLVQHRRYDATHAPGRVSWFNRSVTFNNPGCPFGMASEGRFGEHSDYRNPTITRGLTEAGYVERMGRGIRRVRLLLERNGNPELEVETDGYTTVTLRRAV